MGSEAKSAVPALLDALKAKQVPLRCLAAAALSRIDAQAAGPALREVGKDLDGEDMKEFVQQNRKSLKDEKAHFRREAAWGLGALGPAAQPAVPELIEALKDKKDYVRRGAAWALGGMGAAAKAAVPALTEALGDVDNQVRSEAASALGGIGVAAKAAVPAMIKALKDKDPQVRSDAAAALKNIDLEAAKEAGVP